MIRASCSHGHEMTPENVVTRVSHGRYYSACRTCKRKSTQEYNARHKNPITHRAWRVVGRYLGVGKLRRSPCAVCGATRVHAHHPNGYEGAAVLDVVWLCPKHHAAEHRLSPSPQPDPTEDGA